MSLGRKGFKPLGPRRHGGRIPESSVFRDRGRDRRGSDTELDLTAFECTERSEGECRGAPPASAIHLFGSWQVLSIKNRYGNPVMY